jgi:serine/threonine-protein kinase
MTHPLLDVQRIDQTPDAYVRRVGDVFAEFGQPAQDSGNVSYGVRVGPDRFFIKTAGAPTSEAFASHDRRVAWLRNAVRVRHSCDDQVMPKLHGVIESPHGPMLVYQWVDGELLHVDHALRGEPECAHQRFRALPADEICHALNAIYALHEQLAAAGWLAVDFYDGALIYDFEQRRMYVMDLDSYRRCPSINDMGRMFGSSRFMAPEEFERGAPLDQRTNVFTLGRTAAVLLSDGTLHRASFRGTDAQYDVMIRACRPDRDQRYGSVGAFVAAWRSAPGQ